MRYKAVLFDMDGTILDTLEDLHQAVNASLRHFSLPEISREATRQYVGNGARRLIEQAVPTGTAAELTEELLSYYILWYDRHSEEKTAPYAGVPEMLNALRKNGLRLAVISNKPDQTVRSLAARYFGDFFESCAGEKAGIRRKPAPDTVFLAMREMGLRAEECVYVGDSEVDVATARNAGVDCISVAWGFRSLQQLREAGAAVFAETPENLTELLLK